MAIHIRIRESQQLVVKRRRFRISLTSVVSAFVLLLVVACVLYKVLVDLPLGHSSSFTAYNPKETTEEEEQKEPLPEYYEAEESSSASSAAPVTVELYITSDTSTIQLPVPEVSNMDLVSPMSNGLAADLGVAPGALSGNGTGNGNGLGDGGGSGKDKKKSGSRHGKGSNDDIQVVILLDASGSMDQLFTAAAASLERLLTMLNSCRLNGRPAKVNLGIVAYGQARGNGAPWTVAKFSKDVKSMSKRLSEVACDGSEEHCGEAIQYALNEFPWNMRERDQILKVIFIAGNESFDQGPVSPATALRLAKEKGVIVNTIVCGGMEESWTKAAQDGGGESFAIDLNASEDASPEDRLKAAKRLYDCEVIPTGSPKDIEREEKELRSRPSLPNARTVDTWINKNQQLLVKGYQWDAVQICMQMGNDFSLEMVGGLANLPEKIRAMGEDGALAHIQKAAEARADALEDFKETLSGGSEFCNAALEALRKQAASKGIDIEL